MADTTPGGGPGDVRDKMPDGARESEKRTNAANPAAPGAPGAPRAPGPRAARVTVQLGAVAAETGGTEGAELDPGATVASAVVPSAETPSSTPGGGSRPRKNTLAAAIRPRNSDEHRAIPAYHPDSDELPGGFAYDSNGGSALIQGAYTTDESAADGLAAGLGDEIPDETEGADDWSVVDQPTVLLVQQMLAGNQPAADGADAGPDAAGAEVPRVKRGPVTTERATWAPLPAREAGGPQAMVEQQQADPRQPKTTRPIHPDVLGGPRYAAPDGKLMPVTPPEGVPRVAAGNMRVERFQHLRGSRKAHEQGERAPQDPPRVSEMARTFWNDLLPGVKQALHMQHEARASGAYAVPEYLATAVSWLGDVFGKVAVSTRDLANRAQQTAGPTLKRWHEHAEQYAQRLIDRLDGGPIQQQAPFLAPGRIAVLFRSGVTIPQAQRLLHNAQARPLRAIPHKHGYLALVRPGREGDIAERLRQHPYVRDVIFMEYSQADDPSRSLSVEVPALAAMRR